MIQKLYSPVFCRIYAEEDYQYDTPEVLSQRAAADYLREIKDLIKSIKFPEEEKRGLMEYYHKADSVDEKVTSLFIEVEIIDEKLWGVTTIDVTEPLNREEMRLLKDYITGQMSDGFGESLEQRDIKTEDGDLYVSLWDSGDEFYIDTAQEFCNRTGIEVPEIVANLRSQLIERTSKNWGDYRNTPHSTTPDNLFNTSVEVINRRNAYVFMNEYQDFTVEQMKCLLQFANPVEVVADYLDPMSDSSDLQGILSNIIEQQEYYKQHYALAETPAADEKFADLHSQLIEKVETEYKQYHNGLFNLSMTELAGKSDFTDAVDTSYKYLTEYRDYTAEDLGFLLKLSMPLEIVAEQVHEMAEKNVSLPMILDFLKDNFEDIYTEKITAEQNLNLPANAPAEMTVQPGFEELKRQLIDRLAENFNVYKADMLDLSKEGLFYSSAEIIPVIEAYGYFSQEHGFTESEIDFLLKFENPLEYLSDKWDIGVKNLTQILDSIFDNQEQTLQNGGYTLVSDKSENVQNKAEKFFTGLAERWDEYVKNNPIPAKASDKSARDKPEKELKELTGMAKLRKAEKEKTAKTEKNELKKSKSMRKHKHGSFPIKSQ